MLKRREKAVTVQQVKSDMELDFKLISFLLGLLVGEIILMCLYKR